MNNPISDPVFKQLLETSESIVYTNDHFSLPENVDFLSENFAVDLYNKMKEGESEYPLYLETPFATKPGFYKEEGVFIANAVPYVKDAVVKKLGQDGDAIMAAAMSEKLYQDDGDTVYFMNKTLDAGESAFSIGDRTYDGLNEFINAQSNEYGKFGVRFLGINTPEVPHYTSTPMIPEDVHEFVYKDVKDKTNMVMRHYKLMNDNTPAERNDDDTIKFFFDGENNMYYEIVQTYFPEAYLNLSDEEKKRLDDANGFIAKIVFTDDSEKSTVKKGIEAADTVRELMGKAQEICLMLDQQSLSHQTNYYQSPYNEDYFTYNYSFGLAPWNTIKNYWNRFFSDARYKYLGFNSWGQDNNKRMLGTVYLKVVIPEIGEDAVWINLSKYILQHFSKDVTALPDYTSDPKENAQNGFVSSAFKLWTYNFESQMILDAFTKYTDDFIKERDQVFERLAGLSIKDIKEYTMILGDNVFIVPPTSIRCMTQTQTERVQLLRSRGAALKQAPSSEKMIELKLYFNNDAGINGTPYEVTLPNGQKTTYYMNGLRSLIAQFKLTPFLPIENNYINQVLNVFAVTLMDLQVATMSGFPSCLEVTLTLQEFNYHIYMPELPLPELLTAEDLSINMFSRCIHYPVMRWYYQRLLQKGEKIKNLEFNSPEYIGNTFGSNTALVPMKFGDSKIEFYLPDKKHLDKRLQAAIKKESRPLRSSYPITDNGKELIRQMAGNYHDLLFDELKAKEKGLDKLVTDPCIIDYSGYKDYGGHTLFDIEKNEVIMNDDGTSFISDVYTFKLTGSKDSFGNIESNQSQDYVTGISTNFSKTAYGVEMAVHNTCKIIYANEEYEFAKDVAKVTGEPDSSKAFAQYFDGMDALSAFGAYEVKESLVDDKNGKEGKFVFTVLVPMPQVLETSTEREEFKKMVLTNLNIEEEKDLFAYNSAGIACVKLEFTIPSKVCKINLFSTDPTTIHVANGDITLSKNNAGLLFLQFCSRNVKSIQLEDGTTETLDYTGDALTEMTPELEEYNKYNYLESEDSIVFNHYDFGEDVNIQSVSCIYSNSLARVKLNAMDGYAHQFCGGQDAVIEISLTTKNKDVASLIQSLPRLAASYVIDYKQILTCWPLRIKSEITKLFGINEVLIESVDLSTVPNFPGLYSINMRMVAVDRSTRNREALKKLEDINNAGSIANDAKNEYNQKTFFDLKRILGKAEIYPDLELPTIDELEYAGYKILKYYNPNDNNRKYLDPDFYFVYAHILTNELLQTCIMKAFAENGVSIETELNDKLGSSYLIENNQGEKDGITSYPIVATAQNDIAVTLEEKVRDAYSTAMISSIGDTLNKKGWNKLSERNKISSRLTQTLSGMQTPMWSLTNEFVFPLRELQYQFVSKEKNDNKDIYRDQIKIYQDRTYSVIDAELNRAIDLTAIGMNDITKENFPPDKLVTNDAMVGWSEERITAFGTAYVRKRGFCNELAHDYEQESTGNTSFKNISKLLLAFADTMTGSAFCEDRLVIPMNVSNTEEDQYANVNWKLKMFSNYGSRVCDQDSVKWDYLEPYCRMRGQDREFARNLEEALAYGYSFGVYQIQTYPKESIIDLMVSEYEKEVVLKSDQAFVFLDPYYRSLQLKDPEGDEIKEYKTRLMLDPAFCAYAYMRNLMVWYKYLLKEEIALSLYETIKQKVAAEVFDTSIYTSIDGMPTQIKTSEEQNAANTQTVYKSVFEDHANAFATAYAALYDTANNEVLVSADVLANESVPEELIPYVQDKKKCTKEDVAKLITSIREKRKKMLDNTSEDKDVKETEIKNYDILLNALGYDPYKDEFFEITKENLIRYGAEVTNQYLLQVQSSNINNQTFDEVYMQLCSDRNNIVTAKLMGLSLLLLKNGGSILSAMRKRDVQELNALMIGLPMPTINSENNLLRKYILALDGRNLVKLENIGNSTQSAEELIKIATMERVNISRSNDMQAYLKDSFLDMIQNDKRGRMLRAFPTYYILFIDEGREIGLWKLHDNFYNMNAISEITVTKSRKIAADTAQITMSNMFKTFSEEDTQRDYETSEINNVRYNMRDAFNSIFSPRVYAMKEEMLRQMQEIPRTAQIQPGVRIHIRMGYGANAADLPVLFNGNIAEVGTSDLVDIVAQGDGAELLNPITDIDDSSDVENKDKFFIARAVENWLTNGATPKEILTSLLITRGTWLQELARKASSGRFFNRNPYGIVHFGDTEYKDMFAAGEVVQNIYEANPRATYGNNEKYSGLETNYDTQATPCISMHLLGKSYWDVMHICASAQPDFVTSVVPFGMRSSIFYGAPRYYYAYDYIQETLENGDKITKERRKPFQQYHFYSSFTDIIHNDIRASASNIKTNAVGLYQETQLFGDKVKQVGPLFVDFDIYPEYQKSMTVDTQLWAKGMPVVGNLFGWTADLSKDVSDKGFNPIPGAKEIAWRMTAAALKNSMRDMYVGELTVIGDPSVKPYDRMFISDVYERMDGQCEVEAVVHTLNTVTGFTTSIYADCISVIDDAYEQYANILTARSMGYASASVAANAVGMLFNMKGRPIVTSLLNMSTKPIGKTADIIRSIGSFLGDDDLELVSKIVRGNDYLMKLTGHEVNSTFLTAFESALKTNGSKLVAFTNLDVVDVIQAEKYLSHLSGTLDDLDNGILKKELIKKAAGSGDEAIVAKQALAEYDEVIKLKKAAIGVYTKSDDALVAAVTKLASNPSVDNASKVIFNEFATNPNFLSEAKNVKNFSQALGASSGLGDDALDVAKALKGVMNSSDDIAKAALSVSDDLIAKGGIKALFSFGGNGIRAGIIATGVWPMLITIAIEAAICALIGGYATEFVYRYLQNLEVLKIYPLKRNGKVMVAGINGHKGVVVGSPTESMQGEWTNFLSGVFDGEKGNFVKDCINFFLTDDKISTAAKSLRRTNGIPEAEGKKDSNVQLEQAKEALAREINSVYSNNSKFSAREIMRLERLDGNLSSASEDYLLDNIISAELSSSPKSTELALKTQPIKEDEEVKQYIDSNFTTIFTVKQQSSVESVKINFVGKEVSLNCYKSDTGAWVVPCLRPEAMLLLKDALRILFDMSGVSDFSAEEIELPHVFITSATIIGGNKSWENTGLAFRLLLDATRYTPEQVITFSEKVKEYYLSIDVPNYMEIHPGTNNQQELLFIVKPIKIKE